MEIIVIFFLLQFVNVMLNTGKTLIMARTDNPHASALINAVTFGFYTTVVKQIATLDLSITIVIVIITNVIGVYATYAIVHKLKKDNLWKIEIYTPNPETQQNIITELTAGNVANASINPHFLTAYCYTQNESAYTAQVIKGAGKGVKYNITEITKRF